MGLKGLVVRQPWIGMILRGEKTWEMRSAPCRYRGPIALIEKGSGTVVGLAEIVDDLAPLGENDLRSNFDRHRIPSNQIGEALRRGWVRPWVLANVSRLSQPVPYVHTSGGSWINLSAEEEAAVFGKSRTGPLLDGSVGAHDSIISVEHTALAQRALRNLRQGPAKLDIPANASTSITRRGNKLYIEVEWDDGSPATRGKWSGPIEAIGICAAALVPFCMLGFITHFLLGVMSSSISALSAFEWLVPILISTLVATTLGQGHLLGDAFGKR